MAHVRSGRWRYLPTDLLASWGDAYKAIFGGVAPKGQARRQEQGRVSRERLTTYYVVQGHTVTWTK